MKFGILFLVVALLCNSSMSIDPSPKKLADLNADVLSLIFDELQILDMLNLLNVYPAVSLAAAAKLSFWRRYKHCEVYIKLKSPTEEFFGFDKLKCIEVHSETIGLNFLKFFGDVIQRLDVRFPTSSVVKSIEKYTSELLTELKLFVDNEHVFKTFDKPLKQLRRLSIKVMGKLETGNMKFVEIFPKIQQLKLDLEDYYLGEYKFFVGEFPHLENLDMHIPKMRMHEYFEFEEMFRKCPIRNLAIYLLTQEFGNKLNEYLPNVETLSVARIYIQNDTRIDNVKHLEIRTFLGETMDHILFSELESLNVKYPNKPVYDDHIMNLIPFFRNHKDIVSKVTISIPGLYKSDLLIELLNELPNTKDLTLEYDHNSIKAIPDILGHNKNLMKLNLLNFRIIDSEMVKLQEMYGDKWSITEYDKDVYSKIKVLSFERIQ